MPKVDPAIWRDMMSYLRTRHAPICRQWFEELEPLEFDTGLLRVQTSTSVQQNYLQRRCREQFTEAAQAVTGNLVAVHFVNEPVAVAAPLGNESSLEASLPDEPEPLDAQEDESGNGDGKSRVTAPPPAPPRNVHQPVMRTKLNDASGKPAVELFDDQVILSPDYSFDNFITGPNNQLAYAAAVAVANQPGTAYNPLFIHGGVGLGKTHLLQAVCQKVLDDEPNTQIVYVSCDAFMNQFIECVQSGQMNEFRHRYRHVDMLVIDDIHFLGSRERTQEEFFHTFNELYQQNKQIVLSSDAAPTEIPHLEERLLSRFQWGLVATVSKPHYETRIAILRAKARLRGIEVPDDVISYLATRIDSNARELEGAITTIQAHGALQSRPIDLRLAREALGDTSAEPRSNQVTLQHIIDVVTQYYNVRLADLQSRRRHKSVTEPRQVCMYLARKRTRFSLEEVGGYFGGRDHTTVMHSIRTVEQRMNENDAFSRMIDQLDGDIQRASSIPS